MKNLWNVMLPWARNGDASDEEGTYSTTVEGDDEDGAKLNAAIEMADSGEKEFCDEEDRQSYIDSRVAGWADVYPQQQQLRQDLSSTFFDELFPDGVCREINLQALAKLLSENRNTIVA